VAVNKVPGRSQFLLGLLALGSQQVNAAEIAEPRAPAHPVQCDRQSNGRGRMWCVLLLQRLPLKAVTAALGHLRRSGAGQSSSGQPQ
jgi:hypothetical protein